MRAVSLTALGPSVLALAAALAAAPADAKKPKAPPTPAGPGWHREAAWKGDCYAPEDFAALAEGPRRMAWNSARDAIVGQWRGERGDGVQFAEQSVTDLETVMMAKADRVSVVAQENYEQCKRAMASGSTGEWEAWLPKIAAKLTEGECPYRPMDYTQFNYLSINSGWQNTVYVCKGDHIQITATAADYYQITAGGAWINASGDPSAKGTSETPCSDCAAGALVMRFTADDHSTMTQAVGLGVAFLAPAHGRVEMMINDDSMSDNKYKVENRLEHHTGIEVRPVE